MPDPKTHSPEIVHVVAALCVRVDRYAYKFTNATSAAVLIVNAPLDDLAPIMSEVPGTTPLSHAVVASQFPPAAEM